MDPISQGAVGAAFAQQGADKNNIRAYAVFGALAGMAPDLDVFINSATDPLLFLEYHRHFTHSLAFIPMGALIVCAVLYRLWRHPLSFKQAYIASLIGYATHGLLDACTSYGTQLFWPFSDMRVAWNNVSVVDPLFTLPLLALVIIATRKHSRRLSFAALAWIIVYLGTGHFQHERAFSAATALAYSRGHTPTRLTVKPGFANLIVWRSIYEHEGRYHVDAVRMTSNAEVCGGQRVDKLDLKKHLPALDVSSQQATDIERFRWFSDDYLAPYGKPGDVIDVRYSALPNDLTPLWGIRINPNGSTNSHVEFVPNRRASSAQSNQLLGLLQGHGCTKISPRY